MAVPAFVDRLYQHKPAPVSPKADPIPTKREERRLTLERVKVARQWAVRRRWVIAGLQVRVVLRLMPLYGRTWRLRNWRPSLPSSTLGWHSIDRFLGINPEADEEVHATSACSPSRTPTLPPIQQPLVVSDSIPAFSMARRRPIRCCGTVFHDADTHGECLSWSPLRPLAMAG